MALALFFSNGYKKKTTKDTALAKHNLNRKSTTLFPTVPSKPIKSIWKPVSLVFRCFTASFGAFKVHFLLRPSVRVFCDIIVCCVCSRVRRKFGEF